MRAFSNTCFFSRKLSKSPFLDECKICFFGLLGSVLGVVDSVQYEKLPPGGTGVDPPLLPPPPPPHSPCPGDIIPEETLPVAAALAAYMLASSWALTMFFLYRIRLLPNQLLT